MIHLPCYIIFLMDGYGRPYFYCLSRIDINKADMEVEAFEIILFVQ